MGNLKKLIIVSIVVFLAAGLFAASFEVQYKTSTTAATTNAITPHFQIINNSGAAVAMNTLKIRYYYAKEGTAGEQFTCDYAGIGSGLVTGTFAAGYLEIGFTGGTVNNGANSGEIQTRFNKTDWSNYDQSNDYSFVAQTAYAANSKITLYQNGNLVWGTPSGGTAGPTPTPTVLTGTATRTATVLTGTATRTATVLTGTATRTATVVAGTPTRTATVVTGTPTRTATTGTRTATRTATTLTRTATRTATATVTTAAVGKVTILPATQTVARGAAFNNNVTVNTGTEMLAAYGVTVLYPSNMMSTVAANVTAGAQGYVSAVNANTAGTLVISGFDTTGKGPAAALALLNIAWTAGSTTGTATLTLSVQTLINATYVTIGTPTGSTAAVTFN